MREVKLITSENEIPKDYHYDTENSWVYEYRNPYTGDVIQVAKEPPLYVKTALIIKELEKIKAEIFNKQTEFINSNLLSECNVRYGLNIAEIIIDKHITELKGE